MAAARGQYKDRAGYGADDSDDGRTCCCGRSVRLAAHLYPERSNACRRQPKRVRAGSDAKYGICPDADEQRAEWAASASVYNYRGIR
jgi:hypothetical protein